MSQLSILLPTFNGARFLRQQIESILGQTAPNFNLLVIDDGSTDETMSIVDEFARADDRIRHLPAVGNRGQRHRLRQLVEAATGNFIAFADQDDIWHPDRNRLLLDAIGDRAIALGRSQLADASGNDLGRSILDAKGVDASKVGPLTALFRPLVSAHAAVIRRSWLDLGAFYRVAPFDLALGIEALFSNGVVYVDEAVVYHRIHGGNQMNGSVAGLSGSRPLPFLHQARSSVNLVPARRAALQQLLAEMARSEAVDGNARTAFRDLASVSWNVWFGMGGRPRSLEREFHRRLASFAASPEDLAAFAEHIRMVTQPRFALGNIARTWRFYRSGGEIA